jgi:hypothetical protein
MDQWEGFPSEEVNSGMSEIELGTGRTGYNSLIRNKLRAVR